jgi:hypothetical protein
MIPFLKLLRLSKIYKNLPLVKTVFIYRLERQKSMFFRLPLWALLSASPSCNPLPPNPDNNEMIQANWNIDTQESDLS